ncbi:MAG: carbohydrate ABC transporter permease [Bacilli bacterium]|nr:carbohydrate ABC transporter permease [Bacilli bacterium]
MKHLKDKMDGILNFSDYKSTKYKVIYGIFIFLLVVFVLTALIPIFWLFISSFKTNTELSSNVYHLFPENFDLRKILAVWNKVDFTKYYLNTIIVVIGAVICSVVFNGLLAYSIGVLKPVGYKVINALILLGYMVPAALGIFPLVISITKVGLINSYVPLWLMFGANAYYYLLFKDSFEKIPAAVIEAARVDGMNDLQIFFRIVIPLSKSIIGVVAIFTMTAAYSDFLLPYNILSSTEMQTVMVAIYNIIPTDTLTLDEELMLLVISIIPQILIFIIFQKQIMNTSASSGMKE